MKKENKNLRILTWVMDREDDEGRTDAECWRDKKREGQNRMGKEKAVIVIQRLHQHCEMSEGRACMQAEDGRETKGPDRCSQASDRQTTGMDGKADGDQDIHFLSTLLSDQQQQQKRRMGRRTRSISCIS